MAESKKAAPAEQPEFRNVVVLVKNHGITKHGRSHAFYAAGTEFDPVKDAAIVFALAQSGAIIEHQ